MAGHFAVEVVYHYCFVR